MLILWAFLKPWRKELALDGLKDILLVTSHFLLWDPYRFLHEIQLNSAVNKMSVDNLATVIGVNLIRSKVEDPAVIMRGRIAPAEEVAAVTAGSLTSMYCSTVC